MSPALRPGRARRRRGAALIMALIFTLMTLFVVTGVLRSLGALATQLQTQAGISQNMAALGYGFALLRTGLPPQGSYVCTLTLTRWFPSQPAVTLDFEEQSDSEHWTLNVQAGSMGGGTACPGSFGAGG